MRYSIKIRATHFDAFCPVSRALCTTRELTQIGVFRHAQPNFDM
jgi:hypothetical protein